MLERGRPYLPKLWARARHFAMDSRSRTVGCLAAFEMSGLLASTPALHAAALLAVGVMAGFVNVAAGGGSLLTVPVMIFLGLPETVANGTSRLAILTQSITATTAFGRAGRIDRGLLWRLGPPALAGASVGAYAATQLSDQSLRAILGWVMLGCAAYVVVNPRLDSAAGARAPRLGPAWVWPTMFVIGVYGGAVQAGVGYLVLAGLVLLLRIDLLSANVLKVVLVGLYTPLALGLFLWHGQVDLWFGLLLSIGQAVGGWLGAAATLKRGETFVRLMLALVVVASGLKLLLD
jgi:uncharacterized membrane protein YfcA